MFAPSKASIDLALATSPNRDVYIASRSGDKVSVESVSQGGGAKEKTEAELRKYFQEQLGLVGENLDAAVALTREANDLAQRWLTAVKIAGYPEFRELQLAIAADRLRLQQIEFEARLADVRYGRTPTPESPFSILFDWSIPAQQRDVIRNIARAIVNQRSK